MFEVGFGRWNYRLAIALNIIVIGAGMAAAMVRSKLSLLLPQSIENLIAIDPTVMVVAGFAGAYVWSLTDVLQRHHNDDLSPSALHFTWLRMLVAAITAPLLVGALGNALSNVLKAALAFGLGTFPTQTLFDFFRSLIKDKIGLSSSPVPAEPPSLHKLQGMTDAIINRLAEEGLYSTEHLAYVDPLRLMLRTNLEWVVIIDLIDQALLFGYVGDRIADLRPIGIRGAIEMARIGEDLVQGGAAAVAEAQKTLQIVARKVGVDDQAASYLAQTLWEDQQVQFIWDLFGELVTEGTPAESKAVGAGHGHR
jgi:hypothetical protein